MPADTLLAPSVAWPVSPLTPDRGAPRVPLGSSNPAKLRWLVVERLVLVHGSVRNGDVAWAAQADLAASFELLVLNRPGFPPNPPEDRIDFEDHGAWLAERLRPGDHLCGHSYGAVVSLCAAELAHKLGSLILIEPPVFGVASENREVAAYTASQRAYWACGPREPRAFLAGFYELAGRGVDLPAVLPADLMQGAQALMAQRGPWEAQPAFSKLSGRGFRTLVVSGGWSSIFETVCDVVAERLSAERAIYPGSGHNVQNAPGFNAGLLGFLRHGTSGPPERVLENAP